MTDILSKHRDLQREKRDRLLKELNYYKEVREKNLLMIRQLQDEADKYDELYRETIDKLKALDS